VENRATPSPSAFWSHDRRHEGSQSAPHPSSLWKLPGEVAITEDLLSVTQWVASS
jgi:hypothetical protein